MRLTTALVILAVGLIVYTREFWLFLILLLAQLLLGGGVEGFPSPSVFP